MVHGHWPVAVGFAAVLAMVTFMDVPTALAAKNRFSFYLWSSVPFEVGNTSWPSYFVGAKSNPRTLHSKKKMEATPCLS